MISGPDEGTVQGPRGFYTGIPHRCKRRELSAEGPLQARGGAGKSRSRLPSVHIEGTEDRCTIFQYSLRIVGFRDFLWQPRADFARRTFSIPCESLGSATYTRS